MTLPAPVQRRLDDLTRRFNGRVPDEEFYIAMKPWRDDELTEADCNEAIMHFGLSHHCFGAHIYWRLQQAWERRRLQVIEEEAMRGAKRCT